MKFNKDIIVYEVSDLFSL